MQRFTLGPRRPCRIQRCEPVSLPRIGDAPRVGALPTEVISVVDAGRPTGSSAPSRCER